MSTASGGASGESTAGHLTRRICLLIWLGVTVFGSYMLGALVAGRNVKGRM